MTTLLDELRANAATLADFDNAPDHIEVDHHGVAALLTRAAKAIEDAEAARDVMRRERNAAMNERDAARADAADSERRLNAEISAMDARDGAYRALRGAPDGSDDLVALAEVTVNERDEARSEVVRLRELATGYRNNAGPW